MYVQVLTYIFLFAGKPLEFILSEILLSKFSFHPTNKLLIDFPIHQLHYGPVCITKWLQLIFSDWVIHTGAGQVNTAGKRAKSELFENNTQIHSHISGQMVRVCVCAWTSGYK